MSSMIQQISCAKPTWYATYMTHTSTYREYIIYLPCPSLKMKVEYLIMVCKAAQSYASTQATKILRVRDGQHMINQLRDVGSDLGRQREKIIAVYNAREVRHSADRLGETLKGVYDLVGDVEGTPVMFGKKKGFGKRVSALVHDIGTHSNALLAATSLAIADRYSSVGGLRPFLNSMWNNKLAFPLACSS